ncbi:hypothetical protein D3C81_1883400 [compost metagenome]
MNPDSPAGFGYLYVAQLAVLQINAMFTAPADESRARNLNAVKAHSSFRDPLGQVEITFNHSIL